MAQVPSPIPASEPTVESAPYPVRSTTASATVKASSSPTTTTATTTATCLHFSDKLLLTITGPQGKLSHWVHVPLANASGDPLNPSFTSVPGTEGDGEDGLLPRADLTATTVLGGTRGEDEVVGQTLATTVASSILVKNPQEERLLVLGLGLPDASDIANGGFDEIIGLVFSCL